MDCCRYTILANAVFGTSFDEYATAAVLESGRNRLTIILPGTLLKDYGEAKAGLLDLLHKAEVRVDGGKVAVAVDFSELSSWKEKASADPSRAGLTRQVNRNHLTSKQPGKNSRFSRRSSIRGRIDFRYLRQATRPQRPQSLHGLARDSIVNHLSFLSCWPPSAFGRSWSRTPAGPLWDFDFVDFLAASFAALAAASICSFALFKVEDSPR